MTFITNGVFRDTAVLSVSATSAPAFDPVLHDPAIVSAVQAKSKRRDSFYDSSVPSINTSVDHVFDDPSVIFIGSVVQCGSHPDSSIKPVTCANDYVLQDPAVVSAVVKTNNTGHKDISIPRLRKSEILKVFTPVETLPSKPQQSSPQDAKEKRKTLIQQVILNTIKRIDRNIAKDSVKMASRLPVLNTSNIPTITTEEAQNTVSPARGAAMKNALLKQLRVPEFRFVWQFWAEKGQSSSAPATNAKETADDYASRPKPLGDSIKDVKNFYEHYNNLPTENLKSRGDSIHLFHLGVKPIWEDPRNERGGAYYFRVSKENAQQFWHEICVLAVGDVLQGAVETKRESFNDEICGVTYSLRWNAVQIAIWNRDSDNEAGIQKLLETVLGKLSDEVVPKRKEEYWYKPHRAHKGFAGSV